MKNSRVLLFPAHSGLVHIAAVFAREMKCRRDMESLALVHGSRDAEAARRSGAFCRVIDLLDGWDTRGAEARVDANRARLAAWEREYGEARVWPFMIQDSRWRVQTYTYAEKLDYLARSLDVIAAIWREWDVAAVLGELTLPCYRLLYHMCTPQRPYLLPCTSRFFHRMYFDDSMYIEWPECIRLYREFLQQGVPPETAEAVRPVLEGIRNISLKPVYFHRGIDDPTGLAAQVRTEAWLHHASHIWHDNVRDRGRNPQGLDWAYYLPHRKAARRYRVLQVERYFRQHALREIPPGPFAVLFLATQPEYTLDVQGWPFLDQPALVRTIAQSLPADTLLLVKEHRVMVPWRTLDFYREMTRLPNVRLIDEKMESQRLVKDSRLVFTVTGTVALEALCLDTPVITFGRVFFNFFEGVTVVRDLFGLPQTAAGLLAAGRRDNSRSAMAALAAMYQSSRPGDIVEDSSGAGTSLLGDALEAELVRRKLIPELAAVRSGF